MITGRFKDLLLETAVLFPVIAYLDYALFKNKFKKDYGLEMKKGHFLIATAMELLCFMLGYYAGLNQL